MREVYIGLKSIRNFFFFVQLLQLTNQVCLVTFTSVSDLVPTDFGNTSTLRYCCVFACCQVLTSITKRDARKSIMRDLEHDVCDFTIVLSLSPSHVTMRVGFDVL